MRLTGLSETDPAALSARNDFDRERLQAASTEGQRLPGLAFAECELIDWNANETDLQGSRFLQTRFEGLNAPVLLARRTSWREVELTSSRIGSAEWYDSDLAQVDIAHSKLGWLNFRATRMHDVHFRGCVVEELDLAGASLTRVAFSDTVINRLILTKSKLEHVDLRGVEFRAIEGLETLRGATLNSGQVADMGELFAEHLGVIVEN